MKQPQGNPSTAGADDDLLPEYDLDYSRSKPNRFAAALGADSVAVVLDPDVATVFHDSAKVNALLRSVIAALPDRAEGTGA
jgi:hypothetical protein